jgi:uncharacterized protein (DUF427 family)
MKAIWNYTIIAEADKADLIYIEGNWYFPKSSVKTELLSPSDMHTTCHWKGEASYYNITVNEQTNEDAAWYYPKPTPSAFEQTKKDFTDYVAFWRGVQVAE